MQNYYCDFCKKVWHLIAEAKGLDCCPDCLGELELAPKHFVPKGGSVTELKDKFAMKFTEDEKKSIYREWRKHIEKIPTQNAIDIRKCRQNKVVSNTL